jgi:uncharacterized protein YPO0396
VVGSRRKKEPKEYQPTNQGVIMKITITDEDILMTETKVPEQFYLNRGQDPQPNAYLQAYLVDHRIYILVDHNKDTGTIRIFHASIDSKESSLYWTEVVRGLGYSDEEQLLTVLKDMSNLDSFFKEESPTPNKD